MKQMDRSINDTRVIKEATIENWLQEIPEENWTTQKYGLIKEVLRIDRLVHILFIVAIVQTCGYLLLYNAAYYRLNINAEEFIKVTINKDIAAIGVVITLIIAVALKLVVMYSQHTEIELPTSYMLRTKVGIFLGMSSHFYFFGIRYLRGLLRLNIIPFVLCAIVYIYLIFNFWVHYRKMVALDKINPYQEHKKFSIENDMAISQIIEDKCGHHELVSHLIDYIRSVQSDISFSLGIIGPWGNGKTSLINLIKEDIKKQSYNTQQLICVDFNSFLHCDQADFMTELYDQILESISSYKKIHEKKFDGKILISSFRRMKKVTRAVLELSKDYNPLANVLSLFVTDYNDLLKIKKSIEDELDMYHMKLVVFLDDFDRMDGDEIIKVLQTIKRNLDLKNIVFIFIYDEEYVKYQLKKINKDDIYLEKFIQAKFTMPTISQKVVGDYLVSAIADRYGNAISKELLDLVKVDYMKYFQHIRDAKVFINSFSIRVSTLESSELYRQEMCYKSEDGVILLSFDDLFIVEILSYVFHDKWIDLENTVSRINHTSDIKEVGRYLFGGEYTDAILNSEKNYDVYILLCILFPRLGELIKDDRCRLVTQKFSKQPRLFKETKLIWKYFHNHLETRVSNCVDDFYTHTLYGDYKNAVTRFYETLHHLGNSTEYSTDHKLAVINSICEVYYRLDCRIENDQADKMILKLEEWVCKLLLEMVQEEPNLNKPISIELVTDDVISKINGLEQDNIDEISRSLAHLFRIVCEKPLYRKTAFRILSIAQHLKPTNGYLHYEEALLYLSMFREHPGDEKSIIDKSRKVIKCFDEAEKSVRFNDDMLLKKGQFYCHLYIVSKPLIELYKVIPKNDIDYTVLNELNQESILENIQNIINRIAGFQKQALIAEKHNAEMSNSNWGSEDFAESFKNAMKHIDIALEHDDRLEYSLIKLEIYLKNYMFDELNEYSTKVYDKYKSHSIHKYIGVSKFEVSQKTLETAKLAEEEIMKGIYYAPNDYYFKHLIGYCYLSCGEYSEAIGHFEQAHELHPYYDKTLRDLGACYGALKNYIDSEEYYTKALHMNPRCHTSLAALGYLNLIKANHKRAIELYLKAIKIDAKDASKHYFLGHAYALEKKVEMATSCFHRVLKKEKGRREIVTEIYEFMLERKEHAKYKRIFENLLVEWPDLSILELFIRECQESVEID